MKNVQLLACLTLLTAPCVGVHAQQLMETGGQKMPDEWIDKDTHHKVVRLTRKDGQNASFYFHNNPFVDNKMVFYSTDKEHGKQIYTVDLTTKALDQITHQSSPMSGEIVGRKGKDVYYQIADSVFATNVNSRKTRLIFVFPADFKASITTLNADETVLAGRYGEGEKEIYKQYPEKSQYFNRIYDAKLPNTLFTINIKTGELKKIHSENTWIGHVQFSPVDPRLLMFCHEGPWQKVDRIWTIDINTKETKLMHKRKVENEIAGHEFFGPDGKEIWYDLQIPKGETFFLGATNVKTGAERKYALTRNEWSIHFNISPDQKLFCGDGGDPGQVAKAPDGMWLYLFRPAGDHFTSEKLVNMKHHGYKLEAQRAFSPDGKWIIFRANFEGVEESYAVEIKKS